jgi:cytochrome P450
MSPDGVHTVELGYNRDPFPLLETFRANGPACPVYFPDGLGIVRWVIARYDDVIAALDDPRLSNNLGHGIPELVRDGRSGDGEIPVGLRAQIRAYELLGKAVGNCDPPQHSRLRKLVVPAFTARRVSNLRSWIAERTEQLLDEVANAAEFDLMDALATKLPIQVMCELLGVPEEGADICRAAANVLGGSVHNEDAAQAIIDSLNAFADYASQLIDLKRQAPGDDVMSDLINAEVDGERLSPDELIAMCGFLLFAGHRTTVQVIGNGTLALLTNPGQLARLRADPGLLPNAVEEFLRFDGPVNPGLTRYALADIEIGGALIPKGSYVIVATAAANRDPASWDDPDELNLSRAFPQPQLAFGYGIHYCLGARLAKTEAQIAIGALLRRYARISLAVPPQELRWEEGFARCLLELPVRVHKLSR